MNSKSTWIWITLAAVLGAAIFGVEKFGRKPAPELVALIPGFRAADVTSVQFTPAGQLEIRAIRTNGMWRLVKPISYPAQAASIEALLGALEKLAPAHTISGSEARQKKNSDAEFGFDARTTLTLMSGEESRQLRIGSRTSPGDQLYVQVVGLDGVNVVDAQLMKLLPGKMDDWRDTGLVDLRGLVFDRIIVSNATAVIELQRDATNLLWRLARPMQARADNFRLADAIQKLHGTRVKSFITDDSKSDGESFGFQNAELELTLVRGTNILAGMQFGKSPTNDSSLVFARRSGFDAVVIVERQAIEPWLAAVNQFRDPHLVTLLKPVEEIEVRDKESFVLQRTATNSWRLLDSDMPVDSAFVGELLLTLTTGRITQFKDLITEADLPKYGLVKPTRQIILRATPTNKPAGATNGTLAELSFGEVKDGNIFVRRADENPVYAIGIEDYARLAVSAWQLRQRAVWRFLESDVARVTVQQGELRTELRHTGTNAWAFAPGSQGIINSGAVEETIHLLGLLDAGAWIARGDEDVAYLGFGATNLTVTVELKNGAKHEVEFGGKSADNYPYAKVQIGGQPCYFEFPIVVHEYIKFALPLPAARP
ncbi:MAG: DUF4340 domain-containing protein [Verrucomicrobiales bacterium]|nr:MAG: DUF4340 domain-containing protein [Verrucomicrobiales bacterium]